MFSPSGRLACCERCRQMCLTFFYYLLSCLSIGFASFYVLDVSVEKGFGRLGVSGTTRKGQKMWHAE